MKFTTHIPLYRVTPRPNIYQVPPLEQWERRAVEEDRLAEDIWLKKEETIVCCFIFAMVLAACGYLWWVMT